MHACVNPKAHYGCDSLMPTDGARVVLRQPRGVAPRVERVPAGQPLLLLPGTPALAADWAGVAGGRRARGCLLVYRDEGQVGDHLAGCWGAGGGLVACLGGQPVGVGGDDAWKETGGREGLDVGA